ncbi:MAG: nitroreductase family deazaflavin-dependent oxidoreductase [Nocardia sp.]|nr:nitroreductase family deazaflavin-dependent oxidoreductase [Nocardia sp.]
MATVRSESLPSGPVPRLAPLARFNRRFVNPVAKPYAAHAPWMGTVVHRGRRSGRQYRTPVNIFPTEHGYRIALTHGTDADWVRNILAAGRFTLVTAGRDVELVRPRVIHEPAAEWAPTPMRWYVRFMRAEHHLYAVRESRAPARSGGLSRRDR